MKLSEQEVQTRKDIIAEGNKIADVYDRILHRIHASESEAQSLKAMRRLRDAMQEFERRNFLLGRQN